MADSKTFDVEVTRTFDAPVEKVWQMWSKPENVKKWWGPKMFSCPIAEGELKEGKKMFVCMKGPLFGFPTIYSTWNYTKVVPNKQIDYTFNFVDKDGNSKKPPESGIPEDGQHTVEFKDLGNGKTEMYMIERGYASEKTQQRSKSGLEQCFDKMAKALQEA